MLAVVARVVALLPWSALRGLGAALGWLAGSVLRIRRAAVLAAMDRAAVARPAREARAMYAGLGAGLFELLWLAAAAPERRARALASHVALDEELERALAAACERGPVVLAASHTANWEVCAYGAARVLRASGRGLAVVAKPLSVGVFDAFCTALRRGCGLEVFGPDGALARSLGALGRGEVVAMLIDQVPERARHGVPVAFLGAPALADRAPAALAHACGATVLVVAGTRHGAAQRVHLLAEIAPAPPLAAGAPGAAPGALPGAWTAQATVEATAALDRFVRAHPSSWLWLHRRWRAPLELRSGRAAAHLVATVHPG
jgi:KDO2-lipid IV(A) lauroyltransferase